MVAAKYIRQDFIDAGSNQLLRNITQDIFHTFRGPQHFSNSGNFMTDTNHTSIIAKHLSRRKLQVLKVGITLLIQRIFDLLTYLCQ
jgi:hypothetical protein